MGTPRNNFTVGVHIQNFRDAREHAQYRAQLVPTCTESSQDYFFNLRSYYLLAMYFYF